MQPSWHVRAARILALALLYAPLVSFADAASPTSPAARRAPLAPQAPLDLMEAAFREGVALYEAGDHRGAVRV